VFVAVVGCFIGDTAGRGVMMGWVGIFSSNDLVGLLVTLAEIGTTRAVGNFAIGIAVIDRAIGANVGDKVLPKVGRGASGELLEIGLIALAVGREVKASVTGFPVALGTFVIPVRGKVPICVGSFVLGRTGVAVSMTMDGRGAICAGSFVLERTGVPESTLLDGSGAKTDTLSGVVGFVLVLESIVGFVRSTGN
jgi:hypothetical protein